MASTGASSSRLTPSRGWRCLRGPPAWWSASWGGYQVTSFWSELSKDRDRKRRVQRRTDAWVLKETMAERQRAQPENVATSGANRAEEARNARDAGQAEAERRNAALGDELASLAGVLSAVVAQPPRTLSALRSQVPFIAFEPPESDAGQSRPTWRDFAPPEKGMFGRWKYERAVAAAQAAFMRACQEHDRLRAETLATARRAHDAQMALARHEHEQRCDEMAAAVGRSDPDAVAELVGAVLHATPPFAGLLAGGRAVYQPEPREVVMEVELPDTDVIPAERCWRYVAVRRVVEPQPRPPKDAAQLYADLIARITLAVMHACFSALDRDVAGLPHDQRTCPNHRPGDRTTRPPLCDHRHDESRHLRRARARPRAAESVEMP